MGYLRDRGWRLSGDWDEHTDPEVVIGARRGFRGRGPGDAGSSPDDSTTEAGPSASSAEVAGGSGPAGGAGGRGAGFRRSRVHLQLVRIHGQLARRVVTQEFRGGDVVAVMGGGDIDLRSRASRTAPRASRSIS